MGQISATFTIPASALPVTLISGAGSATATGPGSATPTDAGSGGKAA